MWPFKSKPKSTYDIQAELRALSEKIVFEERCLPSDMDRYERLIGELYKRGVEPETKLVRKK